VVKWFRVRLDYVEIVDFLSALWKTDDMEIRELRVRIPKKLMIDYQKLCVELELSVPKTTIQLIEHFLQVQKDNLKIKKMMKGIGKC
jgi:hypothetical protein